MYFYIFDVKRIKKKKQVENIKNYLSVLGISGESVHPSAAQSTRELVNLGLSKQYTTIVAVGNDLIANEVASVLVGKKEAMGIIPIDASDELNSLIGSNNWKDACDILRFRKINEIRLGKTASGNFFITSAQLDIAFPVDITLEVKDYMVYAKVKNFTISNYHPEIKKIGIDYLDIVMESVEKNYSIFSKISSVFSKDKNEPKNISLFRARSMRLFTKSPIAILTSGQMIAKTPQYIESTDETLRLITSKRF